MPVLLPWSTRFMVNNKGYCRLRRILAFLLLLGCFHFYDDEFRPGHLWGIWFSAVGWRLRLANGHFYIGAVALLCPRHLIQVEICKYCTVLKVSRSKFWFKHLFLVGMGPDKANIEVGSIDRHRHIQQHGIFDEELNKKCARRIISPPLKPCSRNFSFFVNIVICLFLLNNKLFMIVLFLILKTFAFVSFAFAFV